MMDEKRLHKRHKRMFLVSSVLAAAVVGICLLFAVQVVTRGYVSIGGYSMFRVVTGSMEPEIPKGALLISKETAITDIKEKDIICYKAKIEEIRGSVITHRVTAVETGADGTIYLETKGDANLSTDPYYADETNLVGRVSWHSKKGTAFAGLLSFLSGKIGFFACIVFPILLAAGLMLQSAVNSMQRDLYLLRRELEREREREGESEHEYEGEYRSVHEWEGALRENAEDELLPGYTTLTYADYEAIYETLKRELLEELHDKQREPRSQIKRE